MTPAYLVIPGDQLIILLLRTSEIASSYNIRDHCGYGLSRWEEALLCNASTHWPSPYPQWSVTPPLIGWAHTRTDPRISRTYNAASLYYKPRKLITLNPSKHDLGSHSTGTRYFITFDNPLWKPNIWWIELNQIELSSRWYIIHTGNSVHR